MKYVVDFLVMLTAISIANGLEYLWASRSRNHYYRDYVMRRRAERRGEKAP